MNQEKIERLLRKLLKYLYYYGDPELVRYGKFELDRVYEDLLKINYELRILNNSVDNSSEFWKTPLNSYFNRS